MSGRSSVARTAGNTEDAAAIIDALTGMGVRREFWPTVEDELEPSPTPAALQDQPVSGRLDVVFISRWHVRAASGWRGARRVGRFPGGSMPFAKQLRRSRAQAVQQPREQSAEAARVVFDFVGTQNPVRRVPMGTVGGR